MQDMSEAQGQLGQITADLERDRAAFEEAGRHGRQPTSGTDDSGMITVVLDRHGRLTRVELDNSWERTVGTTGLGGAVISAYRTAAATRAEAWAGAFDDPTTTTPAAAPVESEGADEALVEPPVDPAAATERSISDSMDLARQMAATLQARGDEVSDEALVAGLLSYLEDAERAFDSALGEIDALSTSTATGKSTSGRVTAVVTVMGGEPQSLDIDSSWAPGAHTNNISREIVGAINNAQRVAATRAAEQAAGANQVRALQNPQALLERLRLA